MTYCTAQEHLDSTDAFGLALCFVMWCFVSQFKLLWRGVFECHWLSMMGEPLLLFGICTNPQVLPACTCESAEQTKPGCCVFFLRPICSVLESILINTSYVELLFWLELLGTVVCLITWCTPLACEPGPMISTAWVTQGVGDVLPWCPFELFPPQLHSYACQPPLEIGMMWLAFHCMGLDRA